jgi:hypothetical protein
VTKKKSELDAAELIAATIFSATKPLYKEGEKRRRGNNRARRTYYAPEPKWSQKEIVFEVLPQASRNAGALFSARDLYYATRPLCYADYRWPYNKQLEYPYFSQTLLTEYQEYYSSIKGLWRDPRGHLHEPHTNNVLALGTLEVAAYEFPPYTFDKVLYIEKEGEMPKLKAAKLAERYDMGIVSGKGYPAEAVRTLFERAERGDYQLFVFHDADIDGYNIARVMQEATRRMPSYSVEVVDIGLSVEDALEMGLAPEPFSRKKRMPSGVRRQLSDVEEEYFVYRHERFELNAILPDTRRIEYIEEKLKENDVRDKLVPPEDKLTGMAEELYRDRHATWVDKVFEELVSWEDLKKELAGEFLEAFKLRNSERYIRAGFKNDDTLSWKNALRNTLDDIQRAKHTDALKAVVREKVVEALKKEEEA